MDAELSDAVGWRLTSHGDGMVGELAPRLGTARLSSEGPGRWFRLLCTQDVSSSNMI